MKKKDFLSEVAKEVGVKSAEAEKFYDAFVCVITKALKEGDKVQLQEFGTFEIKAKEAREGFNPFTKEKIQIAASKEPKFKCAKSYKEQF